MKHRKRNKLKRTRTQDHERITKIEYDATLLTTDDLHNKINTLYDNIDALHHIEMISTYKKYKMYDAINIQYQLLTILLKELTNRTNKRVVITNKGCTRPTPKIKLTNITPLKKTDKTYKRRARSNSMERT